MCSVRTYVTHENRLLVQNDVTCENVMCPNPCYTRKYDYCVQTYITHENRMFLVKKKLHTKMSYVRTYVTYENV